jgi:hypothetical protein
VSSICPGHNLILHLWRTPNISCNTSTTRLIAILRVRVFSNILGGLQVSTSRFLKSARLSQEWKYVSRSFKWIGASTFFGNTKRSPNHTAWCSRSWGGKKKQLSHSVSAEKEKHTKNTKVLFWGKGRQLFADFCFSRALLNLNPAESGGWVYVKSLVTNMSFSALS